MSQNDIDSLGTSLEVDSSPSDIDTDSALGDDGTSSCSTSLNSTVVNFRVEHGRRYHAFEENAYWLPNDEQEMERLDLQHIVLRMALNGRLHLAPIPTDVHRVMDLGTGTGRWAIEFADEHPSAEVIGTDLSPIQPTSVPPNCSFMVDNIESDWIFEHPFDFIHCRLLLLGVHDWPRLFRQVFDNLKPGAWFEVQEVTFPVCHIEGSVEPDSAFLRFSQLVQDAAGKDGIDTNPAPRFKAQMEDVGFVNIGVQPIQWPIGSWPKGEREKSIGRLNMENVKGAYGAAAIHLFTKKLDWTKEEVERFLVQIAADLDNRKRHYYWDMNVVYGQKPGSSES